MSQCNHEQVVAGEIYYCQLGEGHARMHYHESDNPAFKLGYRAGQLAMRERAAKVVADADYPGAIEDPGVTVSAAIRALEPEEPR